jgi:hypothetical protein
VTRRTHVARQHAQAGQHSLCTNGTQVIDSLEEAITLRSCPVANISEDPSEGTTSASCPGPHPKSAKSHKAESCSHEILSTLPPSVLLELAGEGANHH